MGSSLQGHPLFPLLLLVPEDQGVPGPRWGVVCLSAGLSEQVGGVVLAAQWEGEPVPGRCTAGRGAGPTGSGQGAELGQGFP